MRAETCNRIKSAAVAMTTRRQFIFTAFAIAIESILVNPVRSKAIAHVKSNKHILIGVGDAGANIINKLDWLHGTESWIHKTAIICSRPESISNAKSKHRIQVPKVEQKISIDQSNQFSKNIKSLIAYWDCDSVICVAGLGGKTGSNFLPILLSQTKKQVHMTSALVTTPFHNEGKRRNTVAAESLDQVLGSSDNFYVCDLENLIRKYGYGITIKEMFDIADSIILEKIRFQLL